MSKLLQYGPECTRISADHGFWDERESRSKGEMVALINSELSEALEAHRKGHSLISIDGGKAANLANDLNNPLWGDQSPEKQELRKTLLPVINALFTEIVKDTVEDEMADVVIRILDYIHGWKIDGHVAEYRKESTGNFGHDILRLQWYMILAFHEHTQISVSYPGKDFYYALAAVEKFCEWYGIDIESHVRWKMAYNKSRPYKHGKKY